MSPQPRKSIALQSGALKGDGTINVYQRQEKS